MDYPKIPEELDKRIKIPKSEHQTIRDLYKSPEWSMRKIAAKYNVDKRTIQFIVYPERLAKSRENRDWRNYYDKEEVNGEAYRLWEIEQHTLYNAKARNKKISK
jgi:hypothetical protein